MLKKPSQTKVRATSGAQMLILLVARALSPAIDPRRFSDVLTAYRLAGVVYSCWQATCLKTKRTSHTERWIC